MAVNFKKLRKEYSSKGLKEEDLLGDPFLQFQQWLEAAVDAELFEPNAMCLASVNAQGVPSTRVVLLKGLSADGLTFFTNYKSRKACDIEVNKHVSVNFLWLPLQRQINIVGDANRISRIETAKYFLTRPLASQLGAWCSPQSQMISSRTILETAWKDAKQRFSDGEVPVPDHWGGYRISPSSFEFWQGGANRLHDRFRYESVASGEWAIERLAP